jgi:hypothetical protein
MARAFARPGPMRAPGPGYKAHSLFYEHLQGLLRPDAAGQARVKRTCRPRLHGNVPGRLWGTWCHLDAHPSDEQARGSSCILVQLPSQALHAHRARATSEVGLQRTPRHAHC